MPYKVTSNRVANTLQVENQAALAVRLMLEAIHMQSTPKTPMRRGLLRADVSKDIRGTMGRIAWGRNYAIYQENKQFTNYTTPGTGPRFARTSVENVVDDSARYFRMAGY